MLLAGGTIALAATGVILTGAAVPPAKPVGPSEGVGMPVSSRLLRLRIQDPEGGPPWGMRIVETSRGLVCAQVGRVHDGQLGELGIDGAFADDGLFHPFPAEVVQSFPGGSTEDGTEIEGGTCTLAVSAAWGSAVAAELWGVDRNAAPSRGHQRSARSPSSATSATGCSARTPSSVTYREGSSVRSEAVVPGVGAYLIVQPGVAGGDHEGSGEAPGHADARLRARRRTARWRPSPTTRTATTCENGYDARTGAKVGDRSTRARLRAAPVSSGGGCQLPASRCTPQSGCGSAPAL